MSATVRPADGYLAVKFVRPNAMGPNGLLIAENLDAAPTFGRVIAAGLGREIPTGAGLVRETMPYAVGDVLKFTEAALVQPDGRAGVEVGLIPIQAVLCKVEDFVEHDEPEFKLGKAMEAAKAQQASPGIVTPGMLARSGRKQPVLAR